MSDFDGERDALDGPGRSDHEPTEAEIELRLVVDNMPSLVAYVDGSRRYRLINRAYQEFFGVRESDLLGRPVRDGVGPEIYEILSPYIDTVLGGERTGYEEQYKGIDGQEHHLSAKIIPYINTDGVQDGYLVIVDDVTDQKALQTEIEQMNLMLERRVAERTRELEIQRARAESLALHDALTGTLNRRAFFEHAGIELESARRSGHPLSLAMVDIDHFKGVNDEFGHDAGDEVLVDLARTVVRLVRPHDVFARLGGEEFVILTPKADASVAGEVMERLRIGIAESAVGRRGIRYTISIGLTEVDPESDTVGSALKRADTALYAAKGGGRNRVVLG